MTEIFTTSFLLHVSTLSIIPEDGCIIRQIQKLNLTTVSRVSQNINSNSWLNITSPQHNAELHVLIEGLFNDAVSGSYNTPFN